MSPHKLEDESDDEDSGVYGAILDLRMGPLEQLEVEWIGVGPHAHDAEHAKVTLAACRAALEKVSDALTAQAKREVAITVESESPQ